MKKILCVLWLLWGMVITPLAMQATDGCTCPCACDDESDKVSYSTDIVINEFLPNPSGDETAGEWIELKNIGGQEMDLCGWQIKDASTKIYTITSEDFLSSQISAGGYFLISRTVSAIALNNTGDEINLYQPDGTLLETIIYNESAPEDNSYARDEDNDWQWTNTPTPDDQNIFNVEDDKLMPEDNNQVPGEQAPVIEDTVIYSQDIIISEIYPSPLDGESEFIELKNNGTKSVDLNGWKLADVSNKKFIFNNDKFSDLILNTGEYLVVYNDVSKIALNNGGDELRLYQPDDNLLQNLIYPNSVKGQSYIYYNNAWSWTDQITPGRDNINMVVVEDKTTEVVAENNYEYSDKIILSEILPDPVGSDSTDEFIEIYNSGDENINLFGWSLTDGTRNYSWDEQEIVKPREYKAYYISETKISLNNSGETVGLLDPKQKVISDVVYEKAINGYSYCFNNEEWAWSSLPTPGQDNIITSDSENIDEGNETSENELSVSSIREALEFEDGSEVMAEGVVSVLPGILGTQYFYIQDQEAGVKIYSSKKYFPENLKIGDLVLIKGKISQTTTEIKINISALEDIIIEDNNQDLEAYEASGLSSDDNGRLVSTESQILELASNKIMLANGIEVYFKTGVGFKKSDYEEGAMIRITGIVESAKDGWHILPRSQDDLVNLFSNDGDSDGLINAAYAAEVSDQQNIVAVPEKNKTLWYLAGFISLSLVVIFVIIIRNQELKSRLKKVISILWVGAEKNTTEIDAPSRCRE
ncbi:MAG: lamin tail domain-containing protein [Patescibacteria group bacterium]